MTDRYYALTVCLEKDIREDDAEHLINAIMMLKGVLKVEPHISDPDIWAAKERALYELRDQIFKVLYLDRKNL